jgi:hypothetical protein
VVRPPLRQNFLPSRRACLQRNGPVPQGFHLLNLRFEGRQRLLFFFQLGAAQKKPKNKRGVDNTSYGAKDYQQTERPGPPPGSF